MLEICKQISHSTRFYSRADEFKPKLPAGLEAPSVCCLSVTTGSSEVSSLANKPADWLSFGFDWSLLEEMENTGLEPSVLGAKLKGTLELVAGAAPPNTKLAFWPVAMEKIKKWLNLILINDSRISKWGKFIEIVSILHTYNKHINSNNYYKMDFKR